MDDRMREGTPPAAEADDRAESEPGGSSHEAGNGPLTAGTVAPRGRRRGRRVAPGKVSRAQRLGGGGQLPHRERLEASFGRDLSGIQAHSDAESLDAAADIGAEAYATGDHVVVPPDAGPGLVAHEVAHVMQQHDGIQAKGGLDGGAGDPLEVQADAVGAAVERGESVAHHFAGGNGARASGAAVQRREKPGAAAKPPAPDPAADAEATLQRQRDQMQAGLQLVTARWQPAAGSLLQPVDKPEQPPPVGRFRQAAYDLMVVDRTDVAPVRAVMKGPGREAYARALAEAENHLAYDGPHFEAIRAGIEQICQGMDLRPIRTRLIAHHALLSPSGRRALVSVRSLGDEALAAYVAGPAQSHGELEAGRDPTVKGADRRVSCERLLAMMRTGAPPIDETAVEAPAPVPPGPQIDPEVQKQADQLRAAIAAAVKKAAPASSGGAPAALASHDLIALYQAIEVAGDRARDLVWADSAAVGQLAMLLDRTQAKAVLDKLDPVERLYQQCVQARTADEVPPPPHGKMPSWATEDMREKLKLQVDGGVYKAMRAWLLARPGQPGQAMRVRLLAHTKLKDDFIDRLPDDNQRMVYRLIERGTEQASVEDKVNEAAERNRGAELVAALRELAGQNPGRLAALEKDMVFRAAIQGMTAEVALPDGQLVRPYHVCLAMWGHEVGKASDPGTVKLSEVDPSAEHVPLTIEDRVRLDKELFERALVALHDETSGKNLAAALSEDASGPRLGLSLVVGVPAASGSRAYQLMMQGKKGDPQAVMDMLVAFDRMAAQDPWRGFLQREHLVFGPELEKRFYQRFQTSLRTWIYENSGPVNRSGANRVLGSEQGSSVGMFNGQVLTAGEVQVAGKMSLHQALREHTAGAPPRPITEWASVESRAIAKAIDDKDKEEVIAHWRSFAGAVAAVSAQLDAATGIQVRAIDLLRNAYLEHHGHMETRLAQKFDEEPRQAIRKEMGLTDDVDKIKGGPPPSVAELAEERYGLPARALFEGLSGLRENSPNYQYVAVRVFLEMEKMLPPIDAGATDPEADKKPGHDVEERPPRSFSAYYRLHYGATPIAHAVAVVRSMGKDRAVQPSEAAALLGIGVELIDKPLVAAPEDGSIGDHNRHLVRASFSEETAAANAAEIWRILLADGRVHLIQNLYGEYNDEEQRLIRIAFRKLSGGFDLQFYLQQMLLERERAKSELNDKSGKTIDDSLDLAKGTWAYKVRVGTEGTAESQKITTNRAITSRAKDSELDQVHAIAMSGDLTPGVRLRNAIKRDSDDECLRIIDELNPEERKQLLRDGPTLAALYSQLSQYAYERAFKVLTGQADLADRLYSRSHGGSWSERKITGGTDETGMREDIKRYIRQLRLQHQRGVRGEVAAMLRPGDQAPDQDVIDKEINRRVAADCLKIASDPNVVTIMKSELDKDERAEMESMILNGGTARDWAVAGGAGKSQIMDEIRGMSAEERRAKLHDPTYMRILGQRLTSEKDYRDALNALNDGAGGGSGGLATLDEKSRSGEQTEGSDRSAEKTLKALTALSPTEFERLRADPRLQLQLMSALATEEQRQIAREFLRGPGVESPPPSKETDEKERAREEALRYIVHRSIHRLRAPCRTLASWSAVLTEAVEVFKAPLEPAEEPAAQVADGKGAANAEKKPAGTDKPVDHRPSIWKAVAADVKAYADRHDTHAGELTTQFIDGKTMRTVVENAVLRVADPSTHLIESKIQTTNEREAERERGERAVEEATGIPSEALSVPFGGKRALDHVYKEEDVIEALKGASDDHVVEHWTTYMAKPAGGVGPTMKEEYKEYQDAYARAKDSMKAREATEKAPERGPQPGTMVTLQASSTVEPQAGGGDGAIDAAAEKAKAEAPPRWTRETHDLGDRDPLIAEAEKQRRQFLEFSINVSATLEKMLRPYMGDDRALTEPSSDPNKPRTATTKNKRYNNLVEVILERVPHLNPAVVATKLGVASHDRWMLRSGAREEIAMYTLRKEKNLRHHGGQTSERSTASAEKEELDVSTYMYYRTFANASTDGKFTGDERDELKYRGEENDRAREAYKTALETAAMWSSLITGVLVTLAATILTGGLALGPLSMMAIGGATALLSATAKAAVNKEILGDEFDSKDKAELVAKEVITGLVTMGTTYFAQRMISAVSGLGTVARQANAARQVLRTPPPLWRTFLNEASEEMTSEVMSTVVEAGLEATNPEHWIDGTRQGAKEAKNASWAILSQAPDRAFTGAITSLVTAGVSRGLKRGRKGAKGEGAKADDFDAPTAGRKREVNIRQNMKAAFGDPEEKFTGAAVEWLISQGGSIDWDNAPEELLKGLLQEYNEVGTERGVQTAQAGRRARKHDRHMAANSQYLNSQEKVDFERMNGTASDTDPFVTAQDYARIRTEVAVAGLAGWESKNGPLAPAQRDAFIRHVREATTAEELSLRAKKDPLSIAEVRQAAVAGQHVQVGKPVAESVARQVIRDLADGKVASLAQLGIEPPPGFDPTRNEWGLGLRTDRQTGAQEYILIKGDSGAVDWADFPDVVALGHSHPDSAANKLKKVDPDGGVAVAEIIATEGPDRVHFLPSGADMVFVFRRGIREHTVFTPFQSRGNGRVGNRVPGSDNPGVDIVIRNPVQVGMLWGNPDLPVVRAEIEVRAGGQLLWSGPIYGADHPSLGSVISDRPAEWMVGADTAAPTAGTANAAPTGVTTTSGSREVTGSAGTGVIQPPVAPSERPTVVGPAVDPTAIPAHERPTGQYPVVQDPDAVPLPVHEQPTGRHTVAQDPDAVPLPVHDRPTGQFPAVTDPSMAPPMPPDMPAPAPRGPRPRGRAGAEAVVVAPVEVNRDAQSVQRDLPELQQATASLPPEAMFGAHHRSRAEVALQQLSDDDYLAFRALIASQQSPVARGFLFKALAAGNSIPEIQWLADEIAVADDAWILDNLTLSDPRQVGNIGLVQQWAMSCNAAMTLTLRGNYDPIFALRLRYRTSSVGGVHLTNPDELNMYQADLERQMLESQYGGDWEGVPERGVARPHQMPDGSEHSDQTRGSGRAADDLLNQQSGATGLRFAPRALGHSSEALPLMDSALAQGLQVPLIVGGPGEGERFAHYVLAMQRRESSDGVVEYQLRDPGGITRWVSADQIRANAMPGDYSQIHAVEVPSAIDAPTVAAGQAPQMTRAPGGGPTSVKDPSDPFQRTDATSEALDRLEAEKSATAGTVDKGARDQLVSDIRRQVPDVALQEQVAAGARTVVRVIASGIKQMNDDILGPKINDTLIDRRNAVVRKVFTARGMAVIESDYKVGTATSNQDAEQVAAGMDKIIADIHADMQVPLGSMIDLAVSHWTAELERKKDTPEAAKIEKMLANATRAQEHPDTIPFNFEVGIAEIAAGEGTGFERGLAAKMSATRAALMSRDEKAGAPDKSDQGGGAKVYSDEAFVEFCREGEAIRERLGEMNDGVITFGDPPRSMRLFDPHGLPAVEAVGALRKGQLDPGKLEGDDRTMAELFQRYYDHINAFDFMKGFTADKIDQAEKHVALAMQVIAALDGGQPVSDEDMKKLLEKDATGEEKQSKDKAPSERAFYDTSRRLQNRLILNADIKDMGNNLMRGYAAQQRTVAERGEQAVGDATLSAEDKTVRFKQTALKALDARHNEILEGAVADAGADEVLRGQLEDERTRGLLFLLGGDEITISLHRALEQHLPMFAALLAQTDVANARVSIMRTGEGSPDGDAGTPGSLKHAMDATVGLKTLKGYEEELRQLMRGVERITGSGHRDEAEARIQALGLANLYVDVMVAGGVDEQVLKVFPTGARVEPADLDARIDDVRKWIEAHGE